MISEFRVYNRYQVLRQREMDKKEQAWENELQEAMNASNPMSYIEEEIQQHHNLHELKSCESCSKLNIQEVGSGAGDVECHPGNIKKSESLHNTTTSIPTHKSKASKSFYKIFKFKSNLLQPKGQSYQLHGPSSPATTPEVIEKNKSEQQNSDILRVDATNISLFCEVEKIDYIDRTPSPERASTESQVA